MKKAIRMDTVQSRTMMGKQAIEKRLARWCTLYARPGMKYTAP